MATIVLVHGSFHGGWCWERVAPRLREAGHDVWTPTLTGLAERRHLLTPDVDLRTHTRDVTELLAFEDLQDVVLVGHSYGGVVIRGVAAAAPSRLASLVYLDAYLPQAGESEVDLWPEAWVDAHREELEQELPVRDPPPTEMLGVEAPEDVAWVESRMTPHPLNTYTQPVPDGGADVPGPSSTARRGRWRTSSGPSPSVRASGVGRSTSSPQGTMRWSPSRRNWPACSSGARRDERIDRPARPRAVGSAYPTCSGQMYIVTSRGTWKSPA